MPALSMEYRTRTRSALSRCKSGCGALNDLSGTSDKPVFEQATDRRSPDAAASAQPTASLKTVSGSQEIRRAQERLKAAGFDPGPIDGILGPQTKSALEQYRSSHKLTIQESTPYLTTDQKSRHETFQKAARIFPAKLFDRYRPGQPRGRILDDKPKLL